MTPFFWEAVVATKLPGMFTARWTTFLAAPTSISILFAVDVPAWLIILFNSSAFWSSRVIASLKGILTCKNLSPLKSNVISFPAPIPILPRLALMVPSLFIAPPSKAVKPPSNVVMEPWWIIEEKILSKLSALNKSVLLRKSSLDKARVEAAKEWALIVAVGVK